MSKKLDSMMDYKVVILEKLSQREEDDAALRTALKRLLDDALAEIKGEPHWNEAACKCRLTTYLAARLGQTSSRPS